MDLLFVIGLSVFLGTGGARIFKKLRIPQVVAYILIGLVLGTSGFDAISKETIEHLKLFNFIALGIIGFTIGGELRKDVFKRYGKSLFIILVLEGLTAFAVVTTAVGLYTGNWPLALILGSIASATAPAATVDVLWEYKTLGVLTTTVLGIVALDDGLALFLYGFASAIAKVILSGGPLSLGDTFLHPLYEIAGAGVIGAVVAFVFRWTLKYTRERDLILAFSLGCIILVVGAARVLGMDLILAAMFFGAVFINLAPQAGKEVFASVQRFSPPIYVLFFVLVGARLKVGGLETWMWIVAVLYVVGRTIGKLAGSNLGARISKAPATVRKYLGFCLFSQAGVAIGLAILASQTFQGHEGISTAVVGVITATTFLVQIIGPPSVKFAVDRAGEVGRNVTEEDLMETFTVKDVMDAHPPMIKHNTTLPRIIEAIAEGDSIYFPVVSDNGKLVGIITMLDLKNILTMTSLGDLIVAWDIMHRVEEKVGPDESLKETVQTMRNRRLDYLHVVSPEDGKLVGFLETHRISRFLGNEIIRRRKEAEEE